MVPTYIKNLKFIYARPTGEEEGTLKEENLDLEIGNKNDFKLDISYENWNPEKHGFGCRIFAPGTEYGGIINDVESIGDTERVSVRGDTWRGLLKYKIVEPPEGQNHLVLNGELNSCIEMLLGDRFDGLFSVSSEDTGIEVENWQVDRYCTLHDAVEKLLTSYGCKMKIMYVQPEGLEYGYVYICAAQIIDYSEMLEYSQEADVKVRVRDCRSGINHLVCAGEGQNDERTVKHLYVQEDGSIGETQFYFGVDERAAVYNFTTADEEKLLEEGLKRLRSLRNYVQSKIAAENIDLEIGDIVSGYDIITKTQVKKPIIGKIIKVKNEETTIEYNMKGDS